MGEIVILGGGESGTGAALLAQSKGFQVFVSDLGIIKEKYAKVLSNAKIPFEQNGHTKERVFAAQEVIKSPGIPDTVALIKQLDLQGTSVIDEIEFAARYTAGKIIGITGSNGKTTTALLTYETLKKAGLKVGLAGNIGHSMAAQLVSDDMDYWVLELSSFQLDRMYKTVIHIAAIINITPDHLDRYNYEFGNYVNSKFRILQNQTEADYLVFFADDEVIQAEMKKTSPLAQRLGFSLKNPQVKGGWLQNEEININIKGKLKMSIQNLALQGKHNLNNSMAASIISQVLDIRKDVIRESMSDFQNVEHRLETFMTISHVDYINDSKATNVNSSWYALESMTHPTAWIVGGVDKGNDYTQLTELVKEKVKFIIALGKDVDKIHAAFGDLVEVYNAADMGEAVGIAYRFTNKGDAVLLSPCCASFDMFDNYEQRGNSFKDMVRSL
ncbi:MAG: UDP-N-acetylmuramoylalanine--D-glutamate ligase [Salibacteraceae bacterium]